MIDCGGENHKQWTRQGGSTLKQIIETGEKRYPYPMTVLPMTDRAAAYSKQQVNKRKKEKENDGTRSRAETIK